MGITIDNLKSASVTPVQGQRVIKIAPGVWIPVGFGGDYIPSSASDSSLLSIEAGYIDDNGNFQPLSFEGTEASDSGSSIQGLSHTIFNTGKPQPDYGGAVPTVSVDFYKCTYVSSDSSMTWRGIKAVLNEGIYSFESNSTEGLFYTSIKPEVDGIYTTDALAVIKRLYMGGYEPPSGAIFYASLQASNSKAETGQALTKQGSSFSYQTYKGVPCVLLSNDSYMTVTSGLSQLPGGSSPFTVSAWCCLPSKAQTYGSFPFGYGYTDNEVGFWFSGQAEGSTNKLNIDFHNSGGFFTGVTYDTGTWYHCCCVWDGTKVRSYINGVAGNSASKTVNMNKQIITIGVRGDMNYKWNGYLAGCRIYKRALTADEITVLASQFTPTA